MLGRRRFEALHVGTWFSGVRSADDVARANASLAHSRVGRPATCPLILLSPACLPPPPPQLRSSPQNLTRTPLPTLLSSDLIPRNKREAEHLKLSAKLTGGKKRQTTGSARFWLRTSYSRCKTSNRISHLLTVTQCDVTETHLRRVPSMMDTQVFPIVSSYPVTGGNSVANTRIPVAMCHTRDSFQVELLGQSLNSFDSVGAICIPTSSG